jgi:hypothetical protein
MRMQLDIRSSSGRGFPFTDSSMRICTNMVMMWYPRAGQAGYSQVHRVPQLLSRLGLISMKSDAFVKPLSWVVTWRQVCPTHVLVSMLTQLL